MTKLLRVGGVPEHFNLPWRLAIDDGAFSTTGAEVEYREVAAGTGELTRQLRANELDVALVLTEGAVADVVRHDASRLVKVYVNSPLTWGIHVAAGSDNQSIADARGKRVAISRYGSGSHLMAIFDAATRGWPTQAMQFVVVDNLDGARRALANGEADVFLWERHMTQPLVDAGEFRRISRREVPWPAFVVSIRKNLLPTHERVIRDVLDIVARHADNFRRRKTAASLISETYGIRPVDAEAWLSAVRWGKGYRRPTAALLRVADALNLEGVIATKQFDPATVWHAL